MRFPRAFQCLAVPRQPLKLLETLQKLSSEKAGGGGSTPSLATIIPEDLSGFVPLTPVRSQSAFTKGTRWDPHKSMALNNLGRCSPFSVRFQSALLFRVAENPCQHSSRRGYAIPTDRVRVELKRQLDVAVAKQRLHGFWIGSGADPDMRRPVSEVRRVSVRSGSWRLSRTAYVCSRVRIIASYPLVVLQRTKRIGFDSCVRGISP